MEEALWLRALVVYPTVIILLRIMGRGLQFQSRPYDIAVQVLIGSAAANLIVNREVEIWRAFPAFGALALLHLILSFASLWNPIKPYLVGKPITVVENGNILKANLLHLQIGVDELMSGLREKNYHNLADVEFAQIESSGKISVIPKSQARPVTPRDLNLPTQYEGCTTVLISDGRVDNQNLTKVGLTESWLTDQLVARGAQDPSNVLFASLDTKGELVVVRHQDVPFLKAIFIGVQAQTTPGLPPRQAQE
jgi:uncharacterized membrane protein YcaP (DUF421 family)